MTQADLAAPDYTKSFISQLEGGFADPSLDTLRFLSRRLRMSLSTIAGDDADQRLAGMEGLMRWARDAARTGDDALARRLLGVATELATSAGWDEHRADAALLLAEIEIGAGAFDRAEALIDEAGALAAAVGQRMLIRKDLVAGVLALRRNDPRGAATAFQRALELSRKSTRHPELTARALFGIAAAAVQAGDLRRARRRLQSAVTLTARQQLDSLHAQARLKLGMTLGLDGAPLDAVGHLQAAAEAFERQGDAKRHLQSLLALAAAALTAGNAALAHRAIDRAAALPDASAVPAAAARIAALRGRALLIQGRQVEAVGLLADAVRQLTGLTEHAELSEAARALGEYYQARADHDAGARYLAIAAEAARAAREDDRRFQDLLDG